MRILTGTAVAVVLGISAPAASAGTAAPAAGRLGPCAGSFLSLSGLTDYRFDGISESDREPTWQVVGYCFTTSGLFIGTQVTGVNFEDQPRTPVEADFYLGRQVQWRGMSVTYNFLYSAFPDKRAPGPSYDIIEPQVEISRTFGRLTLSQSGGWEDDVSGDGQEWRLRSGGALSLTRWLSLSGHIGAFVGARGDDHDHAFYDVGATAAWRRLSLDVRYGGTNLSRADCYYTRWCEPGAYAGVTWRLAP